MFVGFANYYRRFIEKFSRIVALLNRLTEGIQLGNRRQRRSEAQKLKLPLDAVKAFEELKLAFTLAPILRYFDPTKPYRVKTDASGYAISGILC